MRLGGTTSTSLNGVGIQNSLGGAAITTVNFRMNLEDTAGDIFIGVGSGTMFTGNGTFSTSNLMWAIQSDNGNLEYRTGSWNNSGQTLIAGTAYEFHIVANRSGGTVNYGIYSVANGTMDLFINGTLIGNDLAIANNQNADGFRIYQTSGGSYADIDSITIDNTAVAPFTPTAVSLQNTAATSSNSTGLVVVLAVVTLLGTSLWLRRRNNITT